MDLTMIDASSSCLSDFEYKKMSGNKATMAKTKIVSYHCIKWYSYSLYIATINISAVLLLEALANYCVTILKERRLIMVSWEYESVEVL